MWWDEVRSLSARLANAIEGASNPIHACAVIEPGAVIDDGPGPVIIGAGSRICRGAVLRGPIRIGEDCLVGNNAMLRGPIRIGNGVRIGYATEIKQAMIADRVCIGPMCFIADSKVDEDAYLGAQVRTSNHRLDRKEIVVRDGAQEIQTGLEKLGCWIGARAALGIQVIVLPGRVIAQDSMFEPRVTIAHNHPPGRYRNKQIVERV
ncbi:MAG: acetyltransferase [Alphaproteobacteria bacterium]|nr:acetyltransferase [Alphaproteobacteria bacterium]